MALYLCKRKPGALSNPYLIHLFSTSQNDNNENNNNNGFSSSQQSSLNSYFGDVKASRKKQSRLQQQQSATGSPFFRAAPSESASLEEFRKNLAEFRQLSAVPPSPGPNPSSSFQEICKRDANSDWKPRGKVSFEAIRESLRKMRSFENNNNDSSSQQSSLNFYLSDVKASRKKPSQLQQQQNATGSPFSRAASSKSASLEEFRKNLTEFRQRSAVPPSPGPNRSSSFQEIYERDANSDWKPRGKVSFEAIRESLRKMRSFESNNNNDSSSEQSSHNSYLSDVKASRKKPSQLQQQQNATGSPFFRAAPSESASLEEIGKNLAELQQQSSVPPPPGPNHSSSFQEIYERYANSDPKPGGKLSFEAIGESLRKTRSNSSSDSSVEGNVAADFLSLSAFKNLLKLKPRDRSTVIGGTRELPASEFGKEMREERS